MNHKSKLFFTARKIMVQIATCSNQLEFKISSTDSALFDGCGYIFENWKGMHFGSQTTSFLTIGKTKDTDSI